MIRDIDIVMAYDAKEAVESECFESFDLAVQAQCFSHGQPYKTYSGDDMRAFAKAIHDMHTNSRIVRLCSAI